MVCRWPDAASAAGGMLGMVVETGHAPSLPAGEGGVNVAGVVLGVGCDGPMRR